VSLSRESAPFLQPPSSFSHSFQQTDPPPQVPQWGPYMEKHPSQSLLPHISPWHISPLLGFPARPPWKEVPMDRDTLSPEPLVHSFIHSFINSYMSAGVPKNEPAYIWGKTYGHRPWRPTQTVGLHTMGCGLALQGDHSRHCYLHPSACSPWHITFHLGLCRPEPR